MLPFHVLPTSLPAPTTSVRKRYEGPSSLSAANVTASFSVEAGASVLRAFLEKTTSPVVRSAASAEV